MRRSVFKNISPIIVLRWFLGVKLLRPTSTMRNPGAKHKGQAYCQQDGCKHERNSVKTQTTITGVRQTLLFIYSCCTYIYNINMYNLNKYNLYIKYNGSVAFERNATNSLYDL